MKCCPLRLRLRLLVPSCAKSITREPAPFYFIDDRDARFGRASTRVEDPRLGDDLFDLRRFHRKDS